MAGIGAVPQGPGCLHQPRGGQAGERSAPAVTGQHQPGVVDGADHRQEVIGQPGQVARTGARVGPSVSGPVVGHDPAMRGEVLHHRSPGESRRAEPRLEDNQVGAGAGDDGAQLPTVGRGHPLLRQLSKGPPTLVTVHVTVHARILTRNRTSDLALTVPRPRPECLTMPMRLLGNLIVTGLALWLTALILPGMHLGQDAAPVLTQILTIAVIALILSVINAIIRPILSFLAMPITCLTLGLFQLVINTLMLLLAGWVSGLFGLTLEFDTFWWALLAGVIIGLLSAIFEGVTGVGDRARD